VFKFGEIRAGEVQACPHAVKIANKRTAAQRGGLLVEAGGAPLVKRFVSRVRVVGRIEALYSVRNSCLVRFTSPPMVRLELLPRGSKIKNVSMAICPSLSISSANINVAFGLRQGMMRCDAAARPILGDQLGSVLVDEQESFELNLRLTFYFGDRALPARCRCELLVEVCFTQWHS